MTGPGPKITSEGSSSKKNGGGPSRGAERLGRRGFANIFGLSREEVGEYLKNYRAPLPGRIIEGGGGQISDKPSRGGR